MGDSAMVLARMLLGLLPFLHLSCMAMANMDSMKGQHLVVTTILRGEPFLSLKSDHARLSGNEKYEGYLVDLANLLADKLGFTFTLQMVGDGKYGQSDPDPGKWSGMIGEVMSGTADMALVDMTITRAREEVVDFSMPFMHVGITALYKGSLVSLEQLLDNPNINLGVYCCGSSGNFFKTSTVALYQNLYQKMLSDPAGLPESNHAGVTRVKEGGYAYFLESASAEYIVSNNCDLSTVGGNLDSKGYGIVLPQGSPNREDVNLALLSLREAGTLDMLKSKWWENKSLTCKASGFLQTFWDLIGLPDIL